MRIAYVCADPGIPVFGRKGASVHVQEVIRALRDRGAEVELFACRWDGGAPSDMRNLPLHRLPAIPKGNSAYREQAAFAANQALAEMLTNAGPFDAVYERYSLWSHAGMDHAAHQGIAGLLEVNAPLILEQRQYRELVDTNTAGWVAAQAFNQASYLLAVSQPVADYLAGFIGVRERIQIIPNGVDIRRFAPAQDIAAGAENEPFTLGFLGTLKPWHGLSTLIEAFARLQREAPESRLLIVGDGPQRDALEAQANALGVGKQIVFAGAVAPQEVPAWLARMDVAVAPYPDQPSCYFSPLKLFEYLAMGLPVVASRVGQAPEVIEHEIDGLLYPPEDRTQLAALLLRLYEDSALRQRLGQAARRKAVTSHTWDAVAQRILALIKADRTEMSPADLRCGGSS